MKKIPTIFERDWESPKRVVIDKINHECDWVFNGEGKPRRKLDGTCVMFDGKNWFARREIKIGTNFPKDFIKVQHDQNTGKYVGWEPIENSPFKKYFDEALEFLIKELQTRDCKIEEGTYELIGPKINNNPEKVCIHTLRPHAHELLIAIKNFTFEGIKETVLENYYNYNFEGIVWHHPDGRMAKIKARDFKESCI